MKEETQIKDGTKVMDVDVNVNEVSVIDLGDGEFDDFQRQQERKRHCTCFGDSEDEIE